MAIGMSEAYIELIRKDDDAFGTITEQRDGKIVVQRRALLCEVDRLRAENAALLERVDELHDEKSRANRAVDNLAAENARQAETIARAEKHAALLAAEITLQNRKFNALYQAAETAMGHIEDDECRAELREALKESEG